ncbi:MAG: sigma-54-dependent Fis family transcriptional regulator [Candidatus Marinimicrobia bacterium]|nr:sigma-54-dependent Fis family transcriptional regulator [Candidatus Neomarinimicrobiota bacterium]
MQKSIPHFTLNFREIRVLVVDDQLDVRRGLQKLISSLKCPVEISASGEEAITLLQNDKYDIVFTDIKMTGMSGIDLLNWITHHQTGIEVIMVTGFGTIETAVHCLQNGAAHYITKPFDNKEIIRFVERAGYKILLRNYASERSKRFDKLPAIIAEDLPMQQVLQIVDQVAPTSVPVLIEGASGTGKELTARAIHEKSNIRDLQFLAINCAAIPDTLLESELFGYKKGAFTGAHVDTKGIFEQACGGTIFLDEISSMSLNFQSKLLRVLEDKSIRPLGCQESRKVEFRLITATNKDLNQLVGEGQFREDLLYRIKVMKIKLPILNDRRSSIPALADYFVHQFTRDLFGTKVNTPKLTQSALSSLLNHDWRGNVRELENTIQRALVMCDREKIIPSDLGIGASDLSRDEIFSEFPSYEEGKQQAISSFQQQYIRNTLERTNGNITHAAELCGLTRAAFQRIMKKIDIR